VALLESAGVSCSELINASRPKARIEAYSIGGFGRGKRPQEKLRREFDEKLLGKFRR